MISTILLKYGLIQEFIGAFIAFTASKKRGSIKLAFDDILFLFDNPSLYFIRFSPWIYLVPSEEPAVSVYACDLFGSALLQLLSLLES